MGDEQKIIVTQYSMIFVGYASMCVVLDWKKKQVSFEVESNRMCGRFNLFSSAVNALEKERVWLEQKGKEIEDAKRT